MTDLQEDLDQLILEIHAAPLEPARWQGVIGSLSQLLDAQQALMFSMPMAKGAQYWHVSTGMSAESLAEYSSEFLADDVWAAESQRRGTCAGRIAVGEDLVSEPVLYGTRFFNEFLVRFDIERLLNISLLSPVVPQGPPLATLSFYRGLGGSPFGASEKEILSRLSPHLVLALRTYWTWRAISSSHQVISQALDAVTTPIFVIDQTGRLLFANSAGESELRKGECLQVSAGFLVPSHSLSERHACVEVLAQLCRGKASSIRVRIDSSTNQTVIVCTAPLAENRDAGVPWPSAAGLVWLAPAPPALTSVRRIASIHALTHAEERLLMHLAAGARLCEAADELAVTIHTARSHLKSIQKKTGWRTQGELLRMVQQLGVIDSALKPNL